MQEVYPFFLGVFKFMRCPVLLSNDFSLFLTCTYKWVYTSFDMWGTADSDADRFYNSFCNIFRF